MQVFCLYNIFYLQDMKDVYKRQHVMYYGIYRKTDKKIFSSLLTEVKNLHWEDVSQVTESVDNNK